MQLDAYRKSMTAAGSVGAGVSEVIDARLGIRYVVTNETTVLN